MSGIKTVFGGAAVGTSKPFKDQDSLDALFKVLKSAGVTTIDTAQIYGDKSHDSETVLGNAKAGTQFTLDTKHGGGFDKGANREEVVKRAKESIKLLGVDKVYLFEFALQDTNTDLHKGRCVLHSRTGRLSPPFRNSRRH